MEETLEDKLYKAIQESMFKPGGTAKVVALLKQGANPNVPYCGKYLPLNLAANLCNDECCKVLLDHGADPNLKGEEGLNAFDTLFSALLPSADSTDPWANFLMTSGPQGVALAKRKVSAIVQALRNKGAVIPEDKLRRLQLSGCFIATACYGDYNAPEVETLRRFRDACLQNSRSGRYVIAMYYHVSPPIARHLLRHPSLAVGVRTVLLDPMTRHLTKQASVKETT